MDRLGVSRPSQALIVSIVALVVAMTGTGYAAFKLPSNSVGTKQIKKNAVTLKKIKKNAVNGAKIKKNAISGAKVRKNAINGAKVQDNSLTGADINLSELGTVPSATHAASADTASALPPVEATHIVGGPGEPGFLAGSSSETNSGLSGISFKPVGFYKDHEGIVHLQGRAKVGASDGRIFSLPPGYRPASGVLLAFVVYCSNNLGGSCAQDSEGDKEEFIRLYVAGANVSEGGLTLDGDVIARPKTIVSLDGVTFRAEG